MKTLDYLFGYGDLYWPALVAGVAMAVLAGALSVFVVSRRLAFVGQGVSHTAFGGVGLASVLGLTEAGLLTTGGYALVGVFCVVSALVIGLGAGREGHREDTLIGVVLVASMALGMILMNHASSSRPGARLPSFESVLFGSFLGIGREDALVSWLVCVVIVAALWAMRRRLVFVVFDEDGAEASGVRTLVVRAVLMVFLAVSIVMVMKLAGVVLASALLVLPGATSMALTRRLRTSVALSIVGAVIGVGGGVVLSFEMNWPTGPSVVAVMVTLYIASRVVEGIRGAS